MSETTKALNEVTTSIQGLVQHLEKANEQTKRKTFRRYFIAAMWFVLPFATMWSLGVPTKLAAQAAVCPGIAGSLMLVVLVFIVKVQVDSAIGALRELVDGIQSEQQ